MGGGDQAAGRGAEGPAGPPGGHGSAAEIFAVFLRLGLTSFGGPVAHLGCFRAEFVARRRWLDDAAYGELVALCQFLPGPASSQVGFAIGLLRAGWAGALAAFAGFTLPSALLLLAFAMTAARLSGPLAEGALAGLKIVAVAILAQAVWGMARSLCPDRARAAIALGAVALLAAFPGAGGMAGAIAAGAAAGLLLPRGGEAAPAAAAPLGLRLPRAAGLAALAAFALLLAGLPLLAGQSQALAVAAAFFRAGALVFGGGHVVLPLLESSVVQPGWVGRDVFLAGYGAAQAVPGPLFTFAAYLGALLGPGPNGPAGAALALAALFLPGFLILVGVLPFWERLRRRAGARAAIAGANAAVVGILAAALHDPVFTAAVHDRADFALAAACLLLLLRWNAPPWAVVLLGAGAGAARALL